MQQASHLKNSVRKGQALVEFALTATLLFFFLSAVVDIGLLFFSLQGIHNAAQEGATYGSRWLIVDQSDNSWNLNYKAIQDRIRNESGESGGLRVTNLLDLNGNGIPDVVKNPDGTETYEADISSTGVVSGTVLENYIKIDLVTEDVVNGKSKTVGCDPIKLSPQCYIKITVKYRYNMFFALAPVFGKTVDLQSSFYVPVRATYKQAGPGTKAVDFDYWTMTPTNTPTNSPTPSNTSSPSKTPTASPTRDPSISPSPTQTATNSPTGVPVASPTPTLSPTEGPSPTPTFTHTPGPSPTPTSTSTNSPTPSPTTFTIYVEVYNTDSKGVGLQSFTDNQVIAELDTTRFRAVAYDPNDASYQPSDGSNQLARDETNDSIGISLVEFEIYGPSSSTAIHTFKDYGVSASSKPGYCAFGGDGNQDSPCDKIDGKESRVQISKLQSGTYRLRARATAKSGKKSQWVERNFKVSTAPIVVQFMDPDDSSKTATDYGTITDFDLTKFWARASTQFDSSNFIEEQNDGTGIESVEFKVYGPRVTSGDGPLIYQNPNGSDKTVKYCVFGGDGPCEALAENKFAVLNPGIYTIVARAKAQNSFLWSSETKITFKIEEANLHVALYVDAAINGTPGPVPLNNTIVISYVGSTAPFTTTPTFEPTAALLREKEKDKSRFRVVAFNPTAAGQTAVAKGLSSPDLISLGTDYDGLDVDKVEFGFFAPYGAPFIQNIPSDESAAFCFNDNDSSGQCSILSESNYSKLLESRSSYSGTYTLRARARLKDTNKWSGWTPGQFRVFAKPTPTLPPSQTPTPSPTFCPPDVCSPTPTPSVTPTAPPCDGRNEVAGWNWADFGDASDTPGTSTGDSSRLYICGAGTSLTMNSANDDFRFVYQDRADTSLTMVAQLTAWNPNLNNKESANAGLMIRSAKSTNAAYVFLYLAGDGKVRVLYRNRNGAESRIGGNLSGLTPIWLKLVKEGNTITAFFSVSSETTGFEPVTIPEAGGDLPLTISDPDGQFLAGLAVMAGNGSELSRALFTDVKLVGNGPTPTPSNTVTPSATICPLDICTATPTTTDTPTATATPTPSNTPTATPLPPPCDDTVVISDTATWKDKSIGDNGIVPNSGGKTVVQKEDRTYVCGDGKGIWTKTDGGFHYVYQEVTAYEMEVKARLFYWNPEAGLNENAKTGIMIRGSDDPSSSFALVTVTKSGQVRFQFRSVDGTDADQRTGVILSRPIWLKLTKYGERIVASYSTSGKDNSWISIGTSQPVTLGRRFLVGMAVTSYYTYKSTQAGYDGFNLKIISAEPTPTSTNTPGPSPTPTNTATETPTATPTPSNTPTDTPGPSPTWTPTKTPTDTRTPTPTKTASNTPTITPTPFPTGLPTFTPTLTPSLTPSNTPTAIPSCEPGIDPGPFESWTTADIGTTTKGKTTGTISNTVEICGSGANIASGSTSIGDGLRYVSKSESGEISIIAKVDTLYGDAGSRAGLMMRSSPAANAATVMIATRGDGKVEFLYRQTDGGGGVDESNSMKATNVVSRPVWLALVRRGNTVAGYYYDNTTHYWNQLGDSKPLGANTSSSFLVGLAVSSHNEGFKAYAKFNNVTLGRGILLDPGFEITDSARNNVDDNGEYGIFAGRPSWQWAVTGDSANVATVGTSCFKNGKKGLCSNTTNRIVQDFTTVSGTTYKVTANLKIVDDNGYLANLPLDISDPNGPVEDVKGIQLFKLSGGTATLESITPQLTPATTWPFKEATTGWVTISFSFTASSDKYRIAIDPQGNVEAVFLSNFTYNSEPATNIYADDVIVTTCPTTGCP